MVFYFLVYKDATSMVVSRKVEGITVGGKKRDKINNVDTFADLMQRPAMPVKEVHFRGWFMSPVPDYSHEPDRDPRPRRDETLAETLARMKSGESIGDAMKRFEKESKKPGENRASVVQRRRNSLGEVHRRKSLDEARTRKSPGKVQKRNAARRQSFDGKKPNLTDDTVSRISFDELESRTSGDESSVSFTTIPKFGHGHPTVDRSSRVRGCMRVRTLEQSLLNVEPDLPGGIKWSSSHSRDIVLKRAQSGKVQFGTIEIRQYARTIGDNPACSAGPPVSLGWKYRSRSTVVSVDVYESGRKPRRNDCELRLSVKERETILRSLGFTTRDLIEADKEKKKDQISREKTVLGLKYRRVEEKVETAKRFLHLNKRKNKLEYAAPPDTVIDFTD